MSEHVKSLDLETFKGEMGYLQDLFCHEMEDRQIAAYWKIFSHWDSGMFKGVCDGVALTAFKFPAVAMFYKVRGGMFPDHGKFAGAK